MNIRTVGTLSTLISANFDRIDINQMTQKSLLSAKPHVALDGGGSNYCKLYVVTPSTVSLLQLSECQRAVGRTVYLENTSITIHYALCAMPGWHLMLNRVFRDLELKMVTFANIGGKGPLDSLLGFWDTSSCKKDIYFVLSCNSEGIKFSIEK